MRLEFKTIEIHNFMSFEDEVFDFSKQNGMTLVQGKNNDIPNSKNGVGKSQLFTTLLYVLFGQLQNKIKNENIVNRYTADKDMRLVLNFKADSDEYIISRGLNKGKTSYLKLEKKNSKDVTDITKSTIMETQDFLEKEILHCDISIFLRTILLTADQTYNFYMLKKADKKDFVEKLFDISVFGEMYDAIHKDILTLDKSIVSHQNQMLVLGRNIEDYKTRIENYNNTKTSKLKVLTETIDKTKTEYDSLKNSTVDVNAEAVSKLEDASNKLSEAKVKFQSKLRALSADIRKTDSKISTVKANIESKQKVIDKHAVLLNKLCDDCKHVFKEYYSIDLYSKEIDKCKSELAELSDILKKHKKEEKECNDKITEYDNKISLANDRMKSLTAESIRMNRELNVIESRLTSLKSEYDQCNNSENPYTELLEKSKNDMKAESVLLEKIEKKYNYLKTAESIVSQDTLRKFIIRDLVVLLNNRIKTYLTELGAKYYVKFDEDMDYEFITANGSCEFGNFSAGERMRLMIATSFAFRDFMSIRNGLTSNVLILDEYFDSAIDSLCVESIMKILTNFKNNMKQNIFVISHRSEVSQDSFDNIIQIEKTNNISSIKYI